MFFNKRNYYQMQKFEDSFEELGSTGKRSDKGSFKKTKIILNIAQTHYPIIKHIGKKYKWTLSSQSIHFMNFDVCWMDGHIRHQLFSKMQEHQKINRFPGNPLLNQGMGILSRKNHLGQNLMLFRKKFPSYYDFFPLTWNLPEDYSDLQAYHQCRQQGKAQTFIVKPEASCQGKGIFLTRNIQSLKNDKYVVQRYLHKPFLIEGLKFDLRIYVLITGIDPFRIFVYEEGLARFATQPYKPPRSQNLDNRFMHLTNYAVNKDNPNFIFNQSITEMDVGHKRSLSSVFQIIEKEGYDVQQLKQKIDNIIIKTLITGYPHLSSSYLSVHPDNFSNNMSFQILGFDVMIDHKLNPYLIQVNYTPSFATDTPLDRHIKKNLLQDSLRLLNLSDGWRRQVKQKRERQFQERMTSGKRKKYSNEERKIMMEECSRKRNSFEKNNLGNYRKIFLLCQEQMNDFIKYYDYSFQLHNGSFNKSFTTVTPVTQFPFYKHYFSSKPMRKNILPPGSFVKSQRGPLKQKKDNNLHLETIQQDKKTKHNSQMRNITSAKSKKGKPEKRQKQNSKGSFRIQMLQKETEGTMDGCIENESLFQNKLLEETVGRKRRSDEGLMQREEN